MRDSVYETFRRFECRIAGSLSFVSAGPEHAKVVCFINYPSIHIQACSEIKHEPLVAVSIMPGCGLLSLGIFLLQVILVLAQTPLVYGCFGSGERSGRLWSFGLVGDYISLRHVPMIVVVYDLVGRSLLVCS